MFECVSLDRELEIHVWDETRAKKNWLKEQDLSYCGHVCPFTTVPCSYLVAIQSFVISRENPGQSKISYFQMPCWTYE